VLVAISFAVASAAVMHGPGERSHRIPDDAVSRFEAQSIASGHWIAAAPPEADAFKLSMVMVRDGKRFGKDYPGFPMLLAPAERLGLEWLVNPVLGGLLVFGTFLLGRALYDAATGLAAAVVTGASPLLLPLATSYLNTIASGCLLLAAALALWRARERGTRRWAAIGGFLFGWAVATRPFTGALMLLPLSLLLATGRPGGRLLSAGVFGISALPWGIGMLIWNVLLSGDPLTTPYQLWRPTNELGFGETAHGTFGPGEAWKETLGLARRFGDRFVALPLAGLLLLVVPLLGARRAGRRGAGLAAAALVLVAGHFFYAGIASAAAAFGGSRHYGEALPACAILFACPLGALAGRGRAGRWLVAGVLALLAGAAAARSFPAEVEQLRALRANPAVGANRRLEQFVRELAPEPRVLLVDISTYERASALLLNSADVSGPTIVAIYRRPKENRALLDAFPGRSAWLVRWIPDPGAFEITPYVPEEDRHGPPNVFPYTRMYGEKRSRGRS
jgi:hypothetical protein